MKKHPKRKKQVITSILLLSIIIFLLLPSQRHLVKAVFYNSPGIDDHTIFPTRTVKGSNNPQPWKKAKSYNTYDFSINEKETIDKYESVAFLVSHKGKLLQENYWQEYSDTSYSNVFSVAKSIIGLLFGCAIKDGYIQSVDQKISEFIPEFKTGKRSSLTIKDVLTMSSGLNWEESYANPFSLTAQAYYGSDLQSIIYNLEITEEPGKVFKYLSGNTQLLSFVLSNATGMSVSEYASQKLWQPLGTHNNALWYLDTENGHEKSYCCLSSNAQDLAKVGQLILNKGRWKGKSIIPSSYFKTMTSPAEHLVDTAGKKIDYYGYQWWMTKHKGLEIIYARGILGQYIITIPSKKAVIVRLGHTREERKIGAHPADLYLYIDMGLNIIENN